jgi:AP-4 complex subunit epsilon-1
MIVSVYPALAQEHSVAVLDCLDDPDETLKRKTLDLLCRCGLWKTTKNFV